LEGNERHDNLSLELVVAHLTGQRTAKLALHTEKQMGRESFLIARRDEMPALPVSHRAAA
jgi:hypothetical protein